MLPSEKTPNWQDNNVNSAGDKSGLFEHYWSFSFECYWTI